MSARPVPLARRTVFTAVAGAVVVAAVAAVLAVPLLRGVARDQTRAELARAVDSIVAAPAIGARFAAREDRLLGPDDRRYGLVTSTGRYGEGLEVVGDADVTTARTTGSVSTEHRVNGVAYLVEGRVLRASTRAGSGAVVFAVQPVSGIGAATAALLRRLALALLVGILAAATLALLLARRTARPVRAAADRAHRLAAGERGLPAPPPAGIGEVDEMSSALTALDVALATSEGRQREFLLSVSHELRTPLTALQGYAEALRDGAVPAAEVTRVGEVLTQETRRLDRFIADLLALARLEADDFTLDPVPVALDELVTAAVDAWRAAAERAGVELSGEEASGLVARTDPMRLRQLLDGLLENALRVTATGGRIVLAAGDTGAGIELSVTDDGPGLAEGEHLHAFERGYLRDRYAAERPVGTGLGLSIASRLAERMGARLTAAPAPGSGTRITVTLGPGAAG